MVCRSMKVLAMCFLLLVSLWMITNVDSCMSSFVKSNTVNCVNHLCKVCTNGECAYYSNAGGLICNDGKCNKEPLKVEDMKKQATSKDGDGAIDV